MSKKVIARTFELRNLDRQVRDSTVSAGYCWADLDVAAPGTGGERLSAFLARARVGDVWEGPAGAGGERLRLRGVPTRRR